MGTDNKVNVMPQYYNDWVEITFRGIMDSRLAYSILISNPPSSCQKGQY